MISRLSTVLLAGLLVSGSVQSVRAEDKPGSGWEDLVAGDLGKNWTTKGNWSLDKDGVIALTPRPGEKGWTRWDMYLWSKKTYEDFEIEFEYTVQKSGNSGFYFRVGDVNDPVKKGIEVQIYDSASKAPDAKMTDHDSGGVIPGVPPTKNAAKPAGEWNKFQITNKADKLTVVLNGQTVNELNLADSKVKDRPKVGNIGFQDHGLPLQLRNIRIRELAK
jgi:hypothetical protein